MIENPMHQESDKYGWPPARTCGECGAIIDEHDCHIGLKFYSKDELTDVCIYHEIPCQCDENLDKEILLEIIQESNAIKVDY